MRRRAAPPKAASPVSWLRRRSRWRNLNSPRWADIDLYRKEALEDGRIGQKMRGHFRGGEFSGGRPHLSESAGREQGCGNEQLISEVLVHRPAALHEFCHRSRRLLADRFRRLSPL